ncbi:MAG: carboxypeptidase-like regulatory domain-containing protein, partial [Bacteroidota bacterium]
MFKQLLVIVLCTLSYSLFCQVTGKIIDAKTKEPIPSVKITVSDGTMYKSNGEGQFSFNPKSFPVTIISTFIQFTNDTTVVNGPGEITIVMSEPVTNLQTVVISAGKRKQAVEEVPVSMEIIKPQLIDNKGITDLEQAVDQTPGVFTMDGQVSIRGGSGFAYGTGSRVLLLWNGMPLLSGYAGDT